MRVRRKIVFWSLFLITALIQNAGAALTSSYYYGSAFYDKIWEDGYLRGHIDFAVYNDGVDYKNMTGLDKPGDGTYIYAYQIFNNLDTSDKAKAVTYFSIPGLSESMISGMGTQEDSSGGKKPAEWSYTASEGYWKWKLEGTNSLIYKGEHSWLLVFSCNQNWVKGTYDIKGPENESELPVPEIPEPASMLVLLSAGGLMMIKKKERPLQGLRT